ncbi:isopenicillin N synthase family oxygenase [Mucilaginibacter rubeus]|uniref:2-oxoglutarate-dependent ethylene/succinate-forming enzyme n=1 Tax=Mucilaginibacter rubeus TaxID=2027860 RepID=A0AAE6JJ06_9SPHI|nr:MULTISPECIES: 2-oxoglutarate and iron-dependent oxygenase domain-containing protein [Mucilaginibacter]QEM06551.1 isopenicillin N synthase family oxygenase [Mucilaginibacter rubeus]QEM19140.1 isopenicillin N synthase family oxygenase [Mucilaginibacter gossypii]QTE44317.1 isopenicillin N synthase family oxygenase [Mucilaginibacter rubeus]QTE50917.1 isopenicillin N synthase family oxygenase [Mucilaginibacter rubeus]QTE56000.1 isopenicillin N synthase family oxygenase [Mucilaginibacter rubeus]
MSTVNILRLDLNTYINGSADERKQFSNDIGKAFNETGFVIITNHGLSKELIDRLYDQVKTLFALPDAVKQRYEIPGLAGQRGYTGKGKETAKGFKTPDLKEFWQIGQTVTDDEVLKAQYPDNVTVNELPEFNPTTIEVYKKLEAAGKHLLRAIAVYLELPENYFDDKVHNGNSILRTLHYFPITDPDSVPDDAVRAGAHEDINLITLLIGASADGLELLTRDNTWFPVKAYGEDLVVNVGDMLQRLTNNKLKSTTHRVVNPPRELMKFSRFSVPFFLHPKSNMDLTSLDSCIDEQHPKLYTDITAGEYLDERLREIGLKM